MDVQTYDCVYSTPVPNFVYLRFRDSLEQKKMSITVTENLSLTARKIPFSYVFDRLHWCMRIRSYIGTGFYLRISAPRIIVSPTHVF